MSYKQKYIKYKTKYLQLKGGLRNYRLGYYNNKNDGHIFYDLLDYHDTTINLKQTDVTKELFIEQLFASGFDNEFDFNKNYMFLYKLSKYNAVYVIDFANYKHVINQQHTVKSDSDLVKTAINKLMSHYVNSKKLKLNNLYILCTKPFFDQVNNEYTYTENIIKHMTSFINDNNITNDITDNFVIISAEATRGDALINSTSADDFIFWTIAILISCFTNKTTEMDSIGFEKNPISNLFGNVENLNKSEYIKEGEKYIPRKKIINNVPVGLNYGPSLYLVTNDKQKMFDCNFDNGICKNLLTELVKITNINIYIHNYSDTIAYKSEYITHCMNLLHQSMIQEYDHNVFDIHDVNGTDNYNYLLYSSGQKHEDVKNISELKFIYTSNLFSTLFRKFMGLLYYVQKIYYSNSFSMNIFIINKFTDEF